MSHTKICFAASSGGHLEEIMMLKPLMEKYDSVLVTEKTSYDSVKAPCPVYELRQVNRRELMFPIYMLGNTFRALRILRRERPDIVITTGVLAVVPLCLLCKAFHKKLIFIESFAKITDATLTGKILYKHADKFFVQWPSMLEVYPNAVCEGGIY